MGTTPLETGNHSGILVFMNSDGDGDWNPNAFCMDLDHAVDPTEPDGFSEEEVSDVA